MEPTRHELTFWGRAGEPLPWSWACERLDEAREYWLVTVASEGRPSTRPVWGGWDDDRLRLTIGSSTHWRNLRASPHVTVSLGDGAEVVIVEGAAAAAGADVVTAAWIDRYNAKYRWNFTPETIGTTVEVRPEAVLAWITGNSEPGKPSEFPVASSRWTFDR